MMLTLLGYDAEDRGYQNSAAWAGNIMVDARRFGLTENLDSDQTALVPLTRENAAEIVMNAMNANTVESESRRDQGQAYVVSYNKVSTLGYDVFNMVRVTATVQGIDNNGNATFSAVRTNTGNCRITPANINNKVKATAAMVGEDVDVYVLTDGAHWDSLNKGELAETGLFRNVVSSSVAKSKSVPVKVVTGGVRWKDVTTPGASNFVADTMAKNEAGNEVTQYYLNGNQQNDQGAALKAAAALRGTVVEFYTNTDGAISVVKAYRYRVAQLTGDATTKTLSNGTVQVRVPGVTSNWVDTDKISGWEGLVQDDVVLYYTTNLSGASEVAYTIEKAEKVTGTVTSNTSKGVLTINGANYRGSEQPGTGTVGDVTFNGSVDTEFAAWDKNYSLTDEYDFFLDKNGSIVAAVQITESLDSSKVCMVLATERYDSQLGSNGSLSAELLFVDGTTEIVNVSKVGVNVAGKIVAKTVVATKKDASGNYLPVGNDDRQIRTDVAQAALLDNGDVMTKFFTYRATSAGYELTELNAANYPRYWETPVAYTGTAVPSIVKDGNFAKAPGVTTTNGANLANWDITANGNTNFIVGKYNPNTDTTTYTVYKSFKNVPAMDAATMVAICANVDPAKPGDVNKVAKYVYLGTEAFRDDVPDGYIFIRSNVVRIDPELSEDGVYLLPIVDVDGKETEMRITEDLKDSIVSDSIKLNEPEKRQYLGHFFAIEQVDENGTVSVLSNGDIKDANRFDNAVSLVNLTSMGDDVITLANGKSYGYDEATKFIYVDWGWVDEGVSESDRPNVRDEAIDEVSFVGTDTFLPDGFFRLAEVDPDTAANGASYISVQATVVCPAESNIADFVYVLRTLW